MARKNNCSLHGAEIPLSSEFFQEIKQQLWLFLVPVALILILLAVFLEEMGFFFRNIHSSKRRILYLWILGIYPVFGLSSLIGMFVPRSTSLCNFIASLTSVRWMTAAVFQLSVVRTILFFVNLVLWTDEQYDYGDVSYKNPNIYVNALIGVSTFLSFYGYLLFYKATRRALSGFGLRGKFICIVMILFLCGLQSGILETMGAFQVIPCTPPFSRLMRSQSRIVVHGKEFLEGIVPNSARPFNFKKRFRLTEEEALEVSDHFPVEVDLKPSPRQPLHSEL
ncbi:Organic solute transporter subunit alpha [Acipenser ruthenus]|uniref:Organic solute transporter subunit alpha n=1 Tax=Acipenser ruthenus TaxID=7906 RepID=A0A444U493_ACIRT|nr:Organic solute transporter subunit alpha [Acipenser ruthenus]